MLDVVAYSTSSHSLSSFPSEIVDAAAARVGGAQGTTTELTLIDGERMSTNYLRRTGTDHPFAADSTSTRRRFFTKLAQRLVEGPCRGLVTRDGYCDSLRVT